MKNKKLSEYNKTQQIKLLMKWVRNLTDCYVSVTCNLSIDENNGPIEQDFTVCVLYKSTVIKLHHMNLTIDEVISTLKKHIINNGGNVTVPPLPKMIDENPDFLVDVDHCVDCGKHVKHIPGSDMVACVKCGEEYPF